MFRFEPRPVTIRGEEHTFYVFPHPGAVGIVPWQDGKIALVRQFRPAVDRMILEIPAGVLEAGEDPRDAALRELAEETGLRASRMERLGGLYATPGYSAEYLHIYLATDLVAGETHFDAGEEIDAVIWLTPDEVERRIDSGELEDAKTVAAFYLLQRHLQKLGAPSAER